MRHLIAGGKERTVLLCPECGGFLSSGTGEIKSPGYPSSYPRRSSCKWHISVKLGRTIRIRFDEFQIANTSSTCEEDYLVVSDPAITVNASSKEMNNEINGNIWVLHSFFNVNPLE